MTRTRILVAVAAVVIGSAVVGRAVWAAPERAAPARDDGFAGKILVISSKSKTEFGATLEKVQVKEMGGRSFLVGTAADDGQPGNWAKGRTIWFPVDDAAQIVEFPSLEELKKADPRNQ